MADYNIHNATPEEDAHNMKKQAIMLKHGLNVKIDGSWGKWQQEQWDKHQFNIDEYSQILVENHLIQSKKIECWIGILFLIPAILGVFAFLLSWFDFNGDFSSLRNLRGDWTDGDNCSSPAPIYLGLMAIAGAILIKDSFKFLFMSKHKI